MTAHYSSSRFPFIPATLRVGDIGNAQNFRGDIRKIIEQFFQDFGLLDIIERHKVKNGDFDSPVRLIYNSLKLNIFVKQH
jgi:hypothetical protein